MCADRAPVCGVVAGCNRQRGRRFQKMSGGRKAQAFSDCEVEYHGGKEEISH